VIHPVENVPVIRTTRLRMCFDHGGVAVLRGVDLAVREGEFLCVMGPAGSGKTALLSILGCLEHPTEGEYLLAGRNVAYVDEREAARVRRERIGFVFQGVSLVPRLTAVQNVELPLAYAHVSSSERRDRALAALSAVGLVDRADHLPNQLTDGQQQRVAVARALVIRPDVVLADEPTGNLDSGTAEGLLDVLTEVHAGGVTIVMATRVREVAERGGRIVHLLDGQIDAEEQVVTGLRRVAGGSGSGPT
jgi:putative ABC transport system ATP-binding protein